jgi:hypothetical protein
MSKDAIFFCRVSKETKAALQNKAVPKGLIPAILEALVVEIPNASLKYTKAIARSAKRIAKEVVKEDRVCSNKLLDDDMK